MKKTALIFFAFVVLLITGCQNKPDHPLKNKGKAVWTAVDSIDIDAFNQDIKPNLPTMDLGVYFPSNLDENFKKVTLSSVMESVRAAKEIYAPAGVQINLLFVKTGEVDPKYFSIQANEVAGVPRTEYANMYEHMERHPSTLTQETKDALNYIIEPNPDSDRTLYLVVLQDVFYPFLEVDEGRSWTLRSVRTGGLSFPTYMYGENIPPAYRGIFTITNLSRPDRLRSTIAHEIGHKVMNVSHEYKERSPENEIYADGGLMLYGDGEDIPAGEAGRWHKERLHLSPFIYRLTSDGSKNWNPDYSAGGFYYDPIYGDKVIHFNAAVPIDENW